MKSLAVRFERVSKRFRLGESHDSLRDLVGSGIARLLGRVHSRTPSHFWALKDVDFLVPRGDTLGVIGPNGAGKSTALKLLAGILRPDQGRVHVDGRQAALIEVGAGFHGDLSGRENIFLHGAILGMGRSEIRAKLDAIIDFAGIETFLDMPVKRYSSGMYARLGFSIAAHVEPEVLLVDEVLSVGDAIFRLRCLERMRQLVKSGTTLIFVTHDLDQMQSICRRAIVLDKGRTFFDGSSQEAVGRYLNAMSQSFADRPPDIHADREGATALALENFRWLNGNGDELPSASAQEELDAELIFHVKQPIGEMVVELNMRTANHEPLLSFNSARAGVTFDMRPGPQRITLSLPALPLASGQYFWNVRVWDAARGAVLMDSPFRYPLVVRDGGRAAGALCLEHSWTGSAMGLAPNELAPVGSAQ